MKNRNHDSRSFLASADRFIDQGLLLTYIIFSVALLFYMHDGYYDLLRSKAMLFARFMHFYLPVCILSILYKLFRRRFSLKGILDPCIVLLLLSFLISALLSYDPSDAFTGKQGWYVGFFAVLSLTASYFALKGNTCRNDKIYLVFVAVFLVECFLILTDCARLDLLKLKTEFYESEYYGFFGTIGNCNWLVGYLSLMVPMWVCLYVSQDDHVKNCICYIASVAGLLSSVMNGADAIYLAYGCCFIVMIPYLLGQLAYLKRLGLLMVSTCIGLTAIRMIPAFNKRLLRFSGFSAVLFDLKVLLPLLILSLIILILSHALSENRYQKIRKKAILFAETVMILIATLAACFSKGSLDNGRMLIWSHSLKTFINRYSLKMKIFGIGPELLNNVYAPLYEKLGSVCVCSHSEALQMLMTTGIAGLIVWCVVWVLLFITCHKKRTDSQAVALSAGLIAYFAQSFVNSATIPNLVILCLEAILLNQTLHKNEQNDNTIIQKGINQKQLQRRKR